MDLLSLNRDQFVLLGHLKISEVGWREGVEDFVPLICDVCLGREGSDALTSWWFVIHIGPHIAGEGGEWHDMAATMAYGA